MLPEAAYTTRPAATSPLAGFAPPGPASGFAGFPPPDPVSQALAGFPPPGPCTPRQCLPERPQVYQSPSDYPSQQLHALNQARFNAGLSAGAPMQCEPCPLYGCSSAGQNFNASPFRPDDEVSDAYYQTSKGGWTGSGQSNFPWGHEFFRVRDQQQWGEGFCGHMEAGGEGPYLLARLLACLRAVYMTLQTAHWQCKGPGYYGKHLMLQRIYEDVEKTYDGMAERLVGYYGEHIVDQSQQAAWISECVNRWNGIQCPVERAYVAAQEFAQRLNKTYASLQQSGELSLGMENFLGELAANHDQHLYFLQRATAEIDTAHTGASYTGPAIAGQLRDMRELWASPSVPRPVAVPVRHRQGQRFTNVVRTQSGRSRVYWHGPQQWLVPGSNDSLMMQQQQQQQQQGYTGQPVGPRMRRRWRGPFYPTHTSYSTETRSPEGYRYLPDGAFVG